MALLFLVLFVASLDARLEQISGRESPSPLWQIEVPDHWVRESLTPSEDTRLPIAQFKTEEFTLVIHSFPGMNISPLSQVERWKRQSPHLASEGEVEPQAFSGYQGLLYENDTLLAWALSWGASPKIKGEINSPITFKTTGNPLPYRDEITKAVRSFETVEDLCEW